MRYDYKDENLEFIKEKINQIKIALFKSEINSELQLPGNIVSILKIEDDGHVWFFTSCIKNQAENIEKSFYAYLDFHKRGTDCRLQLSGKAIIAETDEDLFRISNYSKQTSGRLVLVKMKIMQAEYFESVPVTNVSLVEKVKAAFTQLFATHEPKVYHFS